MVDHDLSFRGRLRECGSSTSLMNSLRSTSKSVNVVLSLECAGILVQGWCCCLSDCFKIVKLVH